MPKPHRDSVRQTPMWLVGLCIASALYVTTSLVLDKASHREDRAIHWQTPSLGVQSAKAQPGKPILYRFTADWCQPCRALDEALESESIARIINQSFVPIVVRDRQKEEGSNSIEVAQLLSQFAIDAFPTLVILSPDGSFRTLRGPRSQAELEVFLAT